MSIEEAVKKTRDCSYTLSASSESTRNKFLEVLGEKLKSQKERILMANQQDLDAAMQGDVEQQLIKRLKLQQDKLDTLLTGLNNLAGLPDPLSRTTFARELDENLNLYRITCPIGVLCIIFESRPEAVIQISSLAIKSGNCVVLKGGKEAAASNQVLVEIIQESLVDERVGLPKESVILLQTREEIKELLTMDQYIDLVIPRGSNSLVRYIQQNTNIPVMGHADGVYHTFVDESADFAQAASICIDAKTNYPAACNACETVLVHSKIANDFLPKLAQSFVAKEVTMHCDPNSFAIIGGTVSDKSKITQLYKSESEIEGDKAVNVFKKEYLSMDVSIVVVNDLKAAIYHINTYGSHHTDCILSKSQENMDAFIREINSAGVYCNASSRFADGFRYGFGAEVGVSTNKLHARGPVGMEGLLTYKYKLIGQGQIVDDYSQKRRNFTFKDLPIK